MRQYPLIALERRTDVKRGSGWYWRLEYENGPSAFYGPYKAEASAEAAALLARKNIITRMKRDKP